MVKSCSCWNRAIGELFPGSNTPHSPVAEIRRSELSVGRRIRTSWAAPLLYGPRTTGTFPPPPPRGDESETQAAMARTPVIATDVGDGAFQGVLSNSLLQRGSHSLQRASNLTVPVCRRHEARLKW